MLFFCRYQHTDIEFFSLGNKSVENLKYVLDLPCAQPPCPEPVEDHPDELSERCRIEGLHLVVAAVLQVVIVHGATGDAHALRHLVVVHQPLHLKTHTFALITLN